MADTASADQSLVIRNAIAAITLDNEIYRDIYADSDGLVCDQNIKEHMKRLAMAVEILRQLL